MKKIAISVVLMCVGIFAFAQSKATQVADLDYTFTTVKANPITSIKNQASSGTCWAYSTISFLESEAIRLCGIKDPAKYPDFSVFFAVSHSYMDRAVKFVRLDGNLTFGAGSESEDVLHVVRDYGLVPLSEMSGMNYGTPLPAQSELDAVLKGYISAVAKNPNRKLTTAWKPGYQAVLDTYFGKYPETFEVDGKQFDPISYRDYMKIVPEDYVSITSFMCYPFYTWSPLEVGDNWRWDESFNVPIDDMMAVIDNAIEKGYTIAWGSDVSEKGFTRNGLAVALKDEVKAGGSDQERWVGKAKEEKAEETAVALPEEVTVTQEMRQEGYDRKTTTDDHGMHIYGLAKDQNGTNYFMVKNSWGDAGKYKGIWYASDAFVRYKTLNIVVHKDALPKDIKKKLGIK